jgi:hypothetical protein
MMANTSLASSAEARTNSLWTGHSSSAASGEHQNGGVVLSRFGSGRWSFVDFHQARERHLSLLRDRLHSLDAPKHNRVALALPRRSTENPTTYVGPGVADWPAAAPRGVTWLPTAPVSGRPFYPVVLDALESALTLASSDLIVAAAAALAPTWEELERYGLTNPDFSFPRWDDVQGDDDDSRETYLLGAAARALASLGAGYGIIFRGPHWYDHASTVFVRRLLRETELTGFSVALEAPVSLITDLRYHDRLPQPQLVPKRLRTRRPSDAADPVIAWLSTTPHGLPATLVGAGNGPLPSGCARCEGPSGEPWLFLGSGTSRRVRRALAPDAERELHLQIFDRWDPRGWGYLRRAGHAIAAKDAARLRLQHTACNQGLAEIGRDFLYRHFVALSQAGDDRLVNGDGALHAAVGAARLAARARGIGGVRAAVRHYRRALRRAKDPVMRADLVFGIANLLARQRQAVSLSQALKWYDRGERALSHIHTAADRAYMDIRYRNGRALVRYHEGRAAEALALEQDALAIARSLRTRYPRLERWATPIISANTARLLEKRFGDIEGAMTLLKSMLDCQDKLHQEYARLELARLHFDRQEHSRVVELLSGIYETGQPTALDEQQELFGRLIFSLSLSVTAGAERSRPQIPRLMSLLHAAGTPGASQLLAAIESTEHQACATATS